MEKPYLIIESWGKKGAGGLGEYSLQPKKIKT
jgi:hypothetical protein